VSPGRLWNLINLTTLVGKNLHDFDESFAMVSTCRRGTVEIEEDKVVMYVIVREWAVLKKTISLYMASLTRQPMSQI